MGSCSISIGGIELIELIINFKKFLTDGNHENFDRLYAYPVEMWHGGKVHKIRPSVIHLMRGQIFELEEKRYLLLEVPAVMIFQPVFLSQMIQSSSLRKNSADSQI